MIGFDTNGFDKFAKRLRQASSRMAPELGESIRDDLKTAGRLVESRAASMLPKRGGLARKVSAMTLTVTKKSNTTSLTVRSQYNLDRLDQGSVIHPVFGRMPLVRQTIPSGFWTKVVDDAKPRLATSLQKTLDRVIKDI
jgi:hypothetical protein